MALYHLLLASLILPGITASFCCLPNRYRLKFRDSFLTGPLNLTALVDHDLQKLVMFPPQPNPKNLSLVVVDVNGDRHMYHFRNATHEFAAYRQGPLGMPKSIHAGCIDETDFYEEEPYNVNAGVWKFMTHNSTHRYLVTRNPSNPTECLPKEVHFLNASRQIIRDIEFFDVVPVPGTWTSEESEKFNHVCP